MLTHVGTPVDRKALQPSFEELSVDLEQRERLVIVPPLLPSLSRTHSQELDQSFFLGSLDGPAEACTSGGENLSAVRVIRGEGNEVGGREGDLSGVVGESSSNVRAGRSMEDDRWEVSIEGKKVVRRGEGRMAFK
jgi:hypothetical protein